MPRPQTKTQILSASQEEYQALQKLLSTLTFVQMTQPGVLGEWSVKDTLAHLHEWHQMVLSWVASGQRGEIPSVPAKDFKWSQLPALNQKIYEKHLNRPLPEVLEIFHASYLQIMAVIENLSEEELFTPGLFPWMNKNMLSAYFISSTSSHYRWALKEIRSGLKKQSKVE